MSLDRVVEQSRTPTSLFSNAYVTYRTAEYYPKRHLCVDTETLKLFSSVYKETERAVKAQKKHPL